MDPVETVPEGVETGPFHERQRALRATFYEDMGWLWTASFGDPEAEYWAIRRSACLWDVSALVKFRFGGSDAAAALDRLTTRRIADLPPGRARYALILDDNGALLDEGTVFVLSGEEAWFLGNDQRDPFVEHLTRNAHGLDVRIEDVTSRIPNIAVQGPRSFELLAPLVRAELGSLGWFRLFPEPVDLAGVGGILSRTGYSGEIGYEFFLTDGHGAERVWDAILDAGATPIGLDGVELARVEAGLLVQHEDYWPSETDPYELSLDWVIELDHDFVGRDAAARRAAASRRRLVTLKFDGPDVAEHGAEVRSGADLVGDVRSPFVTPRFGPIALAVVDRSIPDGARVSAGGKDATVHPAPIDDPKKVRPRADPRNPITVDSS